MINLATCFLESQNHAFQESACHARKSDYVKQVTVSNILISGQTNYWDGWDETDPRNILLPFNLYVHELPAAIQWLRANSATILADFANGSISNTDGLWDGSVVQFVTSFPPVTYPQTVLPPDPEETSEWRISDPGTGENEPLSYGPGPYSNVPTFPAVLNLAIYKIPSSSRWWIDLYQYFIGGDYLLNNLVPPQTGTGNVVSDGWTVSNGSGYILLPVPDFDAGLYQVGFPDGTPVLTPVKGYGPAGLQSRITFIA